jgi:hypothetical protein
MRALRFAGRLEFSILRTGNRVRVVTMEKSGLGKVDEANRADANCRESVAALLRVSRVGVVHTTRQPLSRCEYYKCE